MLQFDNIEVPAAKWTRFVTHGFKAVKMTTTTTTKLHIIVKHFPQL